MTQQVVDKLKSDYSEVLQNLKEELAKIRTGRANTSMVEDITVEYYGDYVPISQVANLRVADPRLITIQPWEKDMIPKIEKAIRKADLGLNPGSDGEIVRVPIPQLSGERRDELSDMAEEHGEEHKIKMRNSRRDARQEVEDMEESSEISEDVMHRTFEEIDQLTQTFTSKVDETVEDKIEKIQEV
jgi:ribosome recycling factor